MFELRFKAPFQWYPIHELVPAQILRFTKYSKYLQRLRDCPAKNEKFAHRDGLQMIISHPFDVSIVQPLK